MRLERDPAWWQAIADHPQVAPHVFLHGKPTSLADTIARPDIIPLASEHGGLWFHRTEAGDELHAMFTPEGWGAEANDAFKASYEHMIGLGAQLFHVTQIQGSRNSRPPLSHGWRPITGFRVAPHNLMTRTWALPVSDWRASPAYRRYQCRNS